MNRLAPHPLLLTTLLVVGLASQSTAATDVGEIEPQPPQPRKYRLSQIERGKQAVRTAEGTTASAVFDLDSPSGIGRLTIQPTGGKWSRNVTLRLHLRGLEHVQLDNGTHTIISESLRGPKPRATYVTKSGERAKQRQQNEVDSKHAMFLPIRWIEANPRTDRPAGHFEIRVPAAFLKDAPQELHVRWIDFHRG